MPSAKIHSNQSINPPSILSLACDLPNICSLVGLFSALLALFFALTGNYPAAMIGLIWAVFLIGMMERSQEKSKVEQQFKGKLAGK